MRWMAWVVMTSAVWAQNPGCEASPEIRKAIAGVRAKAAASPKEARQISSDGLAGLLNEHPGDFFVAWARIENARSAREEESEILGRYWKAAEASPGNAAAVFLAAQTLVGEKTPAATEMLERLKREKPEFAWTYFALAQIRSYPAFQDLAAIRENLSVFLKACPEALRGYPLAARFGDTEIMKQAAPRLRKVIESRNDAEALQQFGSLWTMEFRVTPLPEHGPLREQVKKDLERIQAGGLDKTQLANIERQAYALMGDTAKAKESAAAMEKSMRDPAATPAFREFSEWQKVNPALKPDASEEEREAYLAKYYAKAEELAAKYPDDSLLRALRFSAVTNRKGASPEEIKAAAGLYIEGVARNPSLATNPYIRVAQAYVTRGIFPDEIPGLIEKAEKAMESPRYPQSDLARPAAGRADYSKLFPAQERTDLLMLKAEYAALRGDAATAGKEMDAAQTAAEELSKIAGSDRNAQRTADVYQLNVYESRARAAEKLGHTLDALTWFRKAADHNAKMEWPLYRGAENSLEKRMRTMWASLGGGQQAWEVWRSGSAPPPAQMETRKTIAMSMPVKEMNLPMAEFSLQDAEGKTWTLAQVKGKATLVNFWATWCAPCREELPHLQKIWNQVRESETMQVLTFNVDDNPGLIEPFLKENQYTFPVILAKSWTDEKLPVEGIPRNLILDAQGVIRQEYLGFGGDPGEWVKKMLGALEGVGK